MSGLRIFRTGTVVSILALAGASLAAGPAAVAVEDPFAAMRVQPVVRDVQAPLFKLETLGGKPVALEDLKGKVVLFYFWRTW